MKFLYKNTAGLSEEDIRKVITPLSDYTTHLQTVIRKGGYDENESSINLPSDKNNIRTVKKKLEKFSNPALKYIVNIGIGGSNLGTKAVYDGLSGFKDLVSPNRFPKIFFADTTDTAYINGLIDFLNRSSSDKTILVNFISKSGTNTEPTAIMQVIFDGLIKRFPQITKRLVITTDHGSPLWKIANDKSIDTLILPKSVGGRYSVLSPVGLFPLAAGGINIDELLEGATAMRSLCVKENLLENPAALSATILFLQSKKGKTINDNFFFDPQLESLGKWYRQLMGESIGKEHNLIGKLVHAGITPTVSIGSTDLHSVAQLYFGGPQDKITTFVSAQKRHSDLPINTGTFTSLIPHVGGKTLAKIMDSILAGVKRAYQNRQMPFTHIVLKEISENEIGQYLQFKMIEMMYLAKLLKVNAFDQPHVELYKTETKKILTTTT